MKIKSSFDNGTLTISIIGYIDSSVANELPDKLNAAIDKHRNEITELVLDADEMTFISSLGLRSILQLKKQWTEMSVINCSPDVYNVFKMTGFTRFLNVTKALPHISKEELQPVKGIDGVFQLSDETMVKVFPRDATLEDVEREMQITREMFIRGVPIVMTFEVVRVGNSYGLVFENVVRKDIDAAMLGELLSSFHQHIIEPDEKLSPAIEREKDMIREKASQAGDEMVSMMLKVLSTIPDGSALVHGELSLSKVAFYQEGNTPVVTDMSHICFGNPLIDLIKLYRSLPEDMQGSYFDDFLHAYYDNEQERDIERIRQNIVTLAKAYHCFENGIGDCWDEILSNLHFKIDFAESIRELERQRFYLDSDVNMDWVASALGTNRHYVSDYFNKVLHTTFSDYINDLRLKHAANLIRSGRVPQSQISYSSGFNNDHTFRRLFKQKYGCTPSQYK